MDEYILKRGFGGEGAYFFYKNGLLHREAGPAYISEEEIEENSPYLNIVDEHLYKKEILEQRWPEDFKEEVLFKKDYYIVLSHSLFGIPYSKEEFNILVLQNQLDKELNTNKTKDKKLKI
jgi:hypothetical protein